jgi:hypothetical protein
MEMVLVVMASCSPHVVETIARLCALRFVAQVPTSQTIATMRVCFPYQLFVILCECVILTER